MDSRSGMKHILHALLYVILLAIISVGFFYSPYGQKLEEDYGLALLFHLRGPRPPPDRVVIVNLDHESSRRLGLPENFSRWPRTVHAQLVEKLNDYGAEVIAFDVFFTEPRGQADDLAFAKAIDKAGNVLLYAELKRQGVSLEDVSAAPDKVALDILVPPIAPFAEAALALAPFPIPKIPVRINQSWIFKDSAGNMPTLPTVALQAMALRQYDLLVAHICRIIPEASRTLPVKSGHAISGPGMVQTLRTLREIFQQHPRLAKQLLSEVTVDPGTRLSDQDRQEIQALIGMYAGDDNMVINFFGPPATLKTFSYHQILAPEKSSIDSIEKQLRGKVVFVGAARRSWSGQKDGFFTVFSQADGLDLSGVEIAATVFANLLENRPVRQTSPGQSILLLSASALGTCLICLLLTPVSAALSLLACSTFYLLSASFFFKAGAVWSPLIVPIFVQPLSTFLIAMACKYTRASRERENIRNALGFYIPDKVVQELTTDLSYIRTGDRMIYGACLLTDAQHYTSLSEKLAPDVLSRLMKEYFQHLFKPVNEQGGIICNVIGDSMLALWPSAKPLIDHRRKACQVAVQLIKAVDEFNRKNPDSQLPTRVGIHYGYLLMGNIGAENHFEYAPVGDIVNTVSRIESLNKLLGTQVLASEEALQGLEDISTRYLGIFLFEGKTKPISIYELLVPGSMPERIQKGLVPIFAGAMNDFQNKNWDQAKNGFQECLTLFSGDSPSQFFLHLCTLYMRNPPCSEWQGIVKISK